MRKLILAWRYYALEREAYYKSLDFDLMNNLKLMAITGILFALFSVYAAINFILSDAVVEHTIPSAIFFGLAVLSALYSIVSINRFEKFKRDGIKSKASVIYSLMLLGYLVIMVSTIYTNVFVAPWGIPVVFVAFLGGAVLLLPPHPPISTILTLAMLAVYFTVSFIQVTPLCCWVCELSDAAFGVIISLVLVWYLNMHKMAATYSTIVMREERDKYADMSITDELTQLHNYRDFMHRLERYLTNYRTADKFMCLAVADIDYFKGYNDHYGHPQGDECLARIGEALGRPWEGKSGMYVARIGGEEFALLWFEEDAANAKKVVLEMERRIDALQIPHEKSDVSPYVSLSIGLDISKSGKHTTTHAAYSAADKALYAAKKGGRKKIVVRFEGEDIS